MAGRTGTSDRCWPAQRCRRTGLKSERPQACTHHGWRRFLVRWRWPLSAWQQSLRTKFSTKTESGWPSHLQECSLEKSWEPGQKDRTDMYCTQKTAVTLRCYLQYFVLDIFQLFFVVGALHNQCVFHLLQLWFLFGSQYAQKLILIINCRKGKSCSRAAAAAAIAVARTTGS